MLITSKSLHHSNIVLMLDEQRFLAPENAAFTALYREKEAQGARFIDDPVIRAKVFTLPAIQLRLTLEGRRFRIDDLSQEEPHKTRIVKDALHAYHNLFPAQPLEGFGFNFDLFYRFDTVIGLAAVFEQFFGKEPLARATLRDAGIQFTLNGTDKSITDMWFIKITAPLEVAAHLNRHFAARELPGQERLQTMFETCYTEADDIMKHFMSRH